MSTQYVQSIIINGNKVLYAYGTNSKNVPVQFFLRGEIKCEETADDAIKRELKEQLNISPNIIFKLKEEFIGNGSTFFIDMTNEELNLEDISIEKNISSSNIEGFKWIPLHDTEKFASIEVSYLRALYEQCIDENYHSPAVDELEKFTVSNNNFNYSNKRLLDKKRKTLSKLIDNDISSGEKLSAIFIALILGITFKVFFKDSSFGVSSVIFTLLFFMFFFWVCKEKIKVKNYMGWFMLICAILLSLDFSIHSNVFLRILNYIMLPLFTTAATLLLCYEDINWGRLSFLGLIVEKITKLTFENLFKPFIFIKKTLVIKKKSELSPTKKNIIKGLAISIPLLFIIIPLLTSADMVFSFYVTRIFKVFDNINTIDFNTFILDSALILLAALYIFGYMWGFKYSYSDKVNLKTSKKAAQWEPVTLLTIIFIINVVYLLFSIVQFSYLYCGGANGLPNGFSFSEYARRGFFELVAITIINFAILLISMKFMNKENKTLNKVAKISLSLLVVFTLNMLFSAHFKMTLYENAFGFTYLRVFVHLFMVLLFLLLLIVLLGIWYEKTPIGKASIIVTVIMYLVLNYANVDAFIAKKNIEVYTNPNSSKQIDIDYLTTFLSYDALPEIIKLENDKNPVVASTVRNYLTDKKHELSKKSSWWEYNLSKARARKLLDIK